ncbi:HSP20-like chaperone [Podospora didyma]|uniref:HSP20-like chaperone n=1 Tax=Podospora didyma TaxID=330526 RepID=A0AAE0P756_9PEZI|nr:HSP20-like chaperone [Podospora didyma]
MSFLPRTLYGSDPSFTPLFRLLDDFDSYSREVQDPQAAGGRTRGHRHHAPTFNPKFDIRETEKTYELHGELPGVERDNVQIEFTEPQTIVIRGRVERTYTAGTPPASLEAPKAADAITEKGEDHNSSHKATVEDEEAEAAKEQGTQVATKKDTTDERPKAPLEKYWVSERSIGEFSRTFSFPTRVDQDGVSAKLNNGVLHVTVPKAKKHETRRVAVN